MRYELPVLDLQEFLDDVWEDAAVENWLTEALAAESLYILPYSFSNVLGFVDFER